MKKILLITDPKTHPEFDTTNELYNKIAASNRFEGFHLPTSAVAEGNLVKVAKLHRELSYPEFLSLNDNVELERSIGSFDLIFDRTDKPYPENFLKVLAKWEAECRFVNSPSSLLESDDHAYFLSIAHEFVPDARIICCGTDLEEYAAECTHFVIKASNSYGGKGVFQVKHESKKWLLSNIVHGQASCSSILEVYDWVSQKHTGDFLVREFSKNVVQGDKRILVVDAEVYGGYIRRSESGSWIQNITSGAKAFKAEITGHESEVIAYTAPKYLERGIRTLGYDFLQDNTGEWRLSEINAGNIGGYGRLEELSNQAVYDKLLTALYDG